MICVRIQPASEFEDIIEGKRKIGLDTIEMRSFCNQRYSLFGTNCGPSGLEQIYEGLWLPSIIQDTHTHTHFLQSPDPSLPLTVFSHAAPSIDGRDGVLCHVIELINIACPSRSTRLFIADDPSILTMKRKHVCIESSQTAIAHSFLMLCIQSSTVIISSPTFTFPSPMLSSFSLSYFGT